MITDFPADIQGKAELLLGPIEVALAESYLTQAACVPALIPPVQLLYRKRERLGVVLFPLRRVILAEIHRSKADECPALVDAIPYPLRDNQRELKMFFGTRQIAGPYIESPEAIEGQGFSPSASAFPGKHKCRSVLRFGVCEGALRSVNRPQAEQGSPFVYRRAAPLRRVGGPTNVFLGLGQVTRLQVNPPELV